MKTSISNLRKLIREALTQEEEEYEKQMEKLWLLIESGLEGYEQASFMWDMLAPDEFPFPLPESVEDFMDVDERPLLFAAIEGSDLDPSGSSDLTWDKLSFLIYIPFSLSTSNRSEDMWRGEKYYSVSSSNPEDVKSEIGAEVKYILRSLPEWWHSPKSLAVRISDENTLVEENGGYALIKVSY